MKVAVFDTHPFEKEHFTAANAFFQHEITFFESRLDIKTASLASGFEAVCSFVYDTLDAKTLGILREQGVKLIALRSAGFNHVDMASATSLKISVVRVPEYSPYSVAEHAAGLILALNRKLTRAATRVRDHNFSLEGLVGFDLHGKCVGVLGTGKIGSVMCKIMAGFGCPVLAYDLKEDPNLLAQGVKYVSLAEIYQQAHILSLHLPLNSKTNHLLNANAFAQMRKGVMVINTGRGALIDSQALVLALKTGQVGFAGLDVYEEEEDVFLQDVSDQVLKDDLLALLLTFPNVLITSHQAFLTTEALDNIAKTTLKSISDFQHKRPLECLVRWDQVGK